MHSGIVKIAMDTLHSNIPLSQDMQFDNDYLA